MEEDNKVTQSGSNLSYEDILKNRREGGTALALTSEQPKFEMVLSGDNHQAIIATAANNLTALQNRMLRNDALMIGVSEEKKAKWLAVADEAAHSMRTLPRRRTMTEKRGAVLQANRHPTAASKYHQAKLEQGHYSGMYTSLSFSLKEEEINLEKMMYKFEKLKQALDGTYNKDDKFLKQKKLELLQLRIVKQVSTIQDILGQAEQYREEIIEWSTIKEELYIEANARGELWSPDDIDGEEGYQEVGLACRHLTNFISLRQNGDSDISSALNIEGLCLTAIQEGIKSGKLGLILAGFADDQIDFIWKNIFNQLSGVKRENGMMLINYGGQRLAFIADSNLYKQALNTSKQLLRDSSPPELPKTIISEVEEKVDKT